MDIRYDNCPHCGHILNELERSIQKQTYKKQLYKGYKLGFIYTTLTIVILTLFFSYI